MSATRTRSGTQTGTLSKIVYVARKVEADLLAIIDTYSCRSEQWAINVMHDVRVLMDEEAIDKIDLAWTRRETNEVLDAYSYQIIIGRLGLADDRSGNIRFRSQLVGADFHFHVKYTSRWRNMDSVQKLDIQERLRLPWTAAGMLDYSYGTWQSDKTYSMDDLGAARNRFIR